MKNHPSVAIDEEVTGLKGDAAIYSCIDLENKAHMSPVCEWERKQHKKFIRRWKEMSHRICSQLQWWPWVVSCGEVSWFCGGLNDRYSQQDIVKYEVQRGNHNVYHQIFHLVVHIAQPVTPRHEYHNQEKVTVTFMPQESLHQDLKNFLFFVVSNNIFKLLSTQRSLSSKQLILFFISFPGDWKKVSVTTQTTDPTLPR